MIKCDYHLHTNHSDGRSTMEEYILRALELKLEELCFTDHYEINADIEDSVFEDTDVDEYVNEFNHMKNKYGHLINLRLGIEIGFRPEVVEQVKELLSNYKFDFVIGACHVIDKQDIGWKPKVFLQKFGAENAHKIYLEQTYKMVVLFNEFDVWAHFDYIVRYCGNEYLDYPEYSELIDKILLELIKKDKGIEVNTSGFNYGLDAPHPNYEILKRYKELGGKIITIGSDAHRLGHLSNKFDEIEQKLKEIGFEYITVYENRVPRFIRI